MLRAALGYGERDRDTDLTSGGAAVEPTWREWVTGCSLAVIAGIGVAAVRADASGLSPAAVAPPVAAHDSAPIDLPPSHSPATRATTLRPQVARSPALETYRRTADRGRDHEPGDGGGKRGGKGTRGGDRHGGPGRD
jgi:hypothetical protein